MFLKLINQSSFWGLIGVILGFLLAEGSRYIHYCLKIKKLKRIIEEELQSILAEIPLKKDIARKIIINLRNGQILLGQSVGIINIGYKQNLTELYAHLCMRQRNCLHVIYETLEVLDKTLSSFESDFKSMLNLKGVSNPFQVFIDRFEDVLKSYERIEILAKEYLSGNTPDVFPIENKGT